MAFYAVLLYPGGVWDVSLHHTHTKNSIFALWYIVRAGAYRHLFEPSKRSWHRFFAISNFAITAWAMAQIIYSFLLELALMDCKFRKQVGNFSYIATNPRPQGRGFLVFTEAAPAVLHSPVLFVLSERKSAEAAGECLLRG